MPLPDLTAIANSPEALLPAAARLLGPGLLTIVRCYGLSWTAPLLSSPTLPQRFRLGLAIILGLCAAVATPAGTATPAGWLALLPQLGIEFALGAALGFSVRMVFSALELAAGLIDAATGSATAAVLHPEQSDDTTSTGAALAVFGGLVWLTLAPLGGDLRLVAGLLDSLRSLPPGSVTDLNSPVQLVRDVLLAGTVLGLQVAAPLVVTLGLLQGLWALLARSRGGSIWTGALSPLRLLLSLLILAATVTDVGTRVVHGVDGLLQGATTSLWADSEGHG